MTLDKILIPLNGSMLAEAALARRLLDLAQDDVAARWRYCEYLAAMPAAAGGVHD